MGCDVGLCGGGHVSRSCGWVMWHGYVVRSGGGHVIWAIVGSCVSCEGDLLWSCEGAYVVEVMYCDHEVGKPGFELI